MHSATLAFTLVLWTLNFALLADAGIFVNFLLFTSTTLDKTLKLASEMADTAAPSTFDVPWWRSVYYSVGR